MKKRTVIGHMHLAVAALERAVLAGARSGEVSERQRERIAFALRNSEDIIEDLKTRAK